MHYFQLTLLRSDELNDDALSEEGEDMTDEQHGMYLLSETIM
jgi:hypothetical protein